MDCAVPNKNEKKLLARAKELGSELTFLYKSKSEASKALKSGYNAGFLLIPKNNSDFKKLRGKKENLIVVMASQENLIRTALESKKVDFVVNIETSTGRDHTHYRRSNVNQVLAKLAKQHNIGYSVDFSRILKTEPGEKRAMLFGRIMTNLRIFNKYKVNCKIYSFASDEFELRSTDALTTFQKVLEK